MLYAIGEIILVVIGILIALQINNWNEQRKNKNKVQSLFIEVLHDLENDIREIDVVFELTDTKDSIANLILNNNYKTEDDKIKGGVSSFFYFTAPFYQTNNGYSNLINSVDNIPKQYRDLVKNLRPLYSTTAKQVDERIESINSLIKEVENYYILNASWYSKDVHLSSEKKIVTVEAIQHFESSTIYKNFVAQFQREMFEYIVYLNILRQLSVLNYANIYETINPDIPKPNFIPTNAIKMSDDELSEFAGCYSGEGVVFRIGKQNGFLLLGDKASNKMILTSNEKGNFESTLKSPFFIKPI